VPKIGHGFRRTLVGLKHSIHPTLHPPIRVSDVPLWG